MSFAADQPTSSCGRANAFKISGEVRPDPAAGVQRVTPHTKPFVTFDRNSAYRAMEHRHVFTLLLNELDGFKCLSKPSFVCTNVVIVGQHEPLCWGGGPIVTRQTPTAKCSQSSVADAVVQHDGGLRGWRSRPSRAPPIFRHLGLVTLLRLLLFAGILTFYGNRLLVSPFGSAPTI